MQSEDEQLAWLGKAWLRPVLRARERCTFILHDDAQRHHPLWDQIASLTEGLPVLQVSSSETAAQLGMAVTPLAPHTLPPKVRWWQLPGSVPLPQREFESFSSLDAYIHSPYQWLLRYAARIRPGALGSVSDGSQLKGGLAHRVYEEFFNAHPAISAINTVAIDSWVDAHIRTLLQQEGALLLESGRQAECERFITQVQDSLTTLVEQLKDASVASVQMELGQEGQFAGGHLNGSIDLLATRSGTTRGRRRYQMGRQELSPQIAAGEQLPAARHVCTAAARQRRRAIARAQLLHCDGLHHAQPRPRVFPQRGNPTTRERRERRAVLAAFRANLAVAQAAV
ncbi:MAG: PD-(D/E)XK nuclease family protein [Haliea sp.]|nr:PD-(D/E)XK nuclease family protein [Haliea sp.]